ncbi:MAG: hypothetical protein UY37_C0010G0009 [Candidatus Beckwithbacteria bacterium GW2011_GWC2_49_11]|nr:MAG: hypothetical protein UY37_C0010G0009 [Candidatus Beckwithbacteria bacterium GW2011_GWC2_49_11]
MLQAADISAAFSQEALEILADTLMLAAKNGYVLVNRCSLASRPSWLGKVMPPAPTLRSG